MRACSGSTTSRSPAVSRSFARAGQAAWSTRKRNRSIWARPYIRRLSNLSPVICPSTCPVLQGKVESSLNRWELSLQPPPQSAAVPHRGTLWPSLAREGVPCFSAHGRGAQNPGRGRKETKGAEKDETMSADRPHPVPSVPLACAITPISRGLGVRVTGAPRRVEAAPEEDEDVGVIPEGCGQLRTNAHTLL